jgi:Cu/Zn superoxide dismutase
MIAIAALLTACGSKPKKVEEPPPVAEQKKQAEPEPAPPPEPEKPKHLGAKAALTPVKGAKMEPGTVSFQQEGDETKVVSEFAGLKNGTYHLVIHDSNECGPNGTKAGAPWKGGEAVDLSFKVGKGQPGNLEKEGVPLKLDGIAPIVGQTLALHDDKKGQAGKMLACGTIDAVGND